MKTNHRRRFKDQRSPSAVFGRYKKRVQGVALDGVVVEATSTSGDHCCGKRGIRRDASGAKRYVHSRIRRRNRDALKKMMQEIDV